MVLIKYNILILVLLFISCNTQTKSDSINTDPEINYRYFGEKYKRMGFEAIRTGDTLLYNEISSIFILSQKNNEDLFFFASIMAYKHNYSQAYVDLNILSHEVYEEKDTFLHNFMLYNHAKYVELRQPSFIYKVIGTDTITTENIQSSSFYLDKLK